jgi:DNA-binding NtrC family response regulator
MSLKILLIGDDERAMQADKIYLKDRGLYVHSVLYSAIIGDLVAEIKPDLIFINPSHPDTATREVYQNFLNNINLAGIPIIYTLAEDDVYLVNRKRTLSKPKRNIIADNMVDAIKLALTKPHTEPINLPITKKHHLPLNRHAYRA